MPLPALPAFVMVLLLSACETVTEHVYGYSSIDISNDFGVVKATITHAVEGEFIQEGASGTFQVRVVVEGGDPNSMLSIKRVTLIEQPGNTIAFQSDLTNKHGKALVNGGAGKQVFNTGRVRLKYVSYDLILEVELPSGSQMNPLDLKGTFNPEYEEHKVFSFWKALMGI